MTARMIPAFPACIGIVLATLTACTTQGDRGQEPTVAAVQEAPVFTTSYPCHNGNTPVQIAICGDSRLAALDVRLAAEFRRHMSADPLFQRDQVLSSQDAWLLALPQRCGVSADPVGNAVPPALVGCLADAYQTQIDTLTAWRIPPQVAPQTAVAAESTSRAIGEYVRYKTLDARQPPLCAALNAGAGGALTIDGFIDPTRLAGAREIAGTHGSDSGTDPSGAVIVVQSHQAGLYGGYQSRARAMTMGGSSVPVIDSTTLGQYVETLPNGGGRFSSFASQTGDYGSIDVFTLDGQILALVTDVIGYNAPAAAGEAAAAGVFTLSQGKAAPACLFETYLRPPEGGAFAEQPSLTPFIALIGEIHGAPPAEFAGSDRQDATYLAGESRWTLFNMPMVVLDQVRQGDWTGWLRYRHDQVLDALFAWSQKSPENQARFDRLFTLLRPAAIDLDRIYVQRQGLSAKDAEQATGLAMMELLYQSTPYLAPGIGGGPADIDTYKNYKPRYPILASPKS